MTVDITPERIHVRWSKAGGTHVSCKENRYWPPDNGAEYVRADMLEALAARLAEAERLAAVGNLIALEMREVETRLAEVVRQRDDLAEQARLAHPTMQRMRLAENKANARAEALAARLAEVEAERDNASDKLVLEKALTDGAHKRARTAEAENAKLREALEQIILSHEVSSIRGSGQDRMAEIARAALQVKP